MERRKNFPQESISIVYFFRLAAVDSSLQIKHKRSRAEWSLTGAYVCATDWCHECVGTRWSGWSRRELSWTKWIYITLSGRRLFAWPN